MSVLKKKPRYVVAVVGATGAVGAELLGLLEERNFPLEAVRLFASERSVGQSATVAGTAVCLEALTEHALRGVDLAFFSATEAVSREYVPRAVASGAVVIDDSSVFRMEPDVPLVVPEINRSALASHRGIIAIPNCSTTQMVMVLKPLHDAARLTRVVVTTLQSVSGSGQRAMIELLEQTRAVLNFKDVEPEVYPHQIAFNCLPHIGSIAGWTSTQEELKMARETRKILGEPLLRLAATTVRVPVFRGHAEAVTIETERRLTAAEARDLLARFPGVTVLDDPPQAVYPMPIQVAGQDEVFVGRIREDDSVPNGLQCWIVADNLRKGAALNAIQIAEALLQMVQ